MDRGSFYVVLIPIREKRKNKGVCKKMNQFRKKKVIQFFLFMLLGLTLIGLTACGGNSDENTTSKEKPKLILGDAGWDSFTFHNEVAKWIIEKGYGYPTDTTMGSTAATFTGLTGGDIDIYMETWSSLLPDYDKAVKSGEVLELSLNYGDNDQGLYVPTYVIKGDAERGIEPIAPELKSIKDLPKYWKLFKDEEKPNKGRIYGAIPGWEVDQILQMKVKTYGLDKMYNYFSPGSDTALASSMTRAYEKGEPWLGYYWEPTWIMGKYDMTLLEDEPYSDELWDNGRACKFPPVRVTVVAHKDMMKKAPDVVAFLKNHKTSSKLTSEALAYMQDHDADASEAAKWFLKEHEELWTKWVSEEVAQKVKAAIE